MPSRAEKRAALLRELKSGRHVSCYEMPTLAGTQYGARISELRHNTDECVRPGYPEGIEHGLNIVNRRDPNNAEHTFFVLEPGTWEKAEPATASIRTRNLVAEAVARDDQRELRKQPALFPEIPARHLDIG